MAVVERVYVAIEGQTLINFDFAYTPHLGEISVTRNGLFQFDNNDYLENTTMSILFISALHAGDVIDVQVLRSDAPEIVKTVENQVRINLRRIRYIPKTWDLFVTKNGLLLIQDIHFKEIDNKTFDLLSPACSGDYIAIRTRHLRTIPTSELQHAHITTILDRPRFGAH